MEMTLDDAKALVLWAQQNGLRAMKVKIKGLDLDVVFKDEEAPGAQDATDLSDIPHTVFKEGESTAKPDEEEYLDDELYAAADDA